MIRRAQRWMVLAGLVPGLMFTGCASLSARYATRPPEGRSATAVARDEVQCEEYSKRHPMHLSYRACMVARSYAANIDMDELGWTMGVAQTQPHDPQTVTIDMLECDEAANKTKDTDSAHLTSEQERSVGLVHASSGLEAYQQRPNAVRKLISCLGERGYEIEPPVDGA